MTCLSAKFHNVCLLIVSQVLTPSIQDTQLVVGLTKHTAEVQWLNSCQTFISITSISTQSESERGRENTFEFKFESLFNEASQLNKNLIYNDSLPRPNLDDAGTLISYQTHCPLWLWDLGSTHQPRIHKMVQTPKLRLRMQSSVKIYFVYNAKPQTMHAERN
jgi:hypothetical protein